MPFFPYFDTVADIPPVEGEADFEHASAPFIIHPMKLGSGTPNGSKVLYGDGTWAAPPAGYTTEEAQDAVGAMVNATLSYVDATPALGINLSNPNTWLADQSVPDEAYGAGWNCSVEVPTKNAVYDKIETITGASGLTAEEVIDLVHPVGSIYVSILSTNPGTLFGFGTWTAFAAGRCLVGLDAGQTEFDTVEETGGAKTHTLLTAEMPAHTHEQTAPTSASGGAVAFAMDTNASGADTAGNNATQSTGGGGAHNNLQPYIVVYIWKRTA